MPASTKPQQFLILPDPVFTSDLVETITSEESRFLGQPIPADANQGDLLPFQQGNPTNDSNLRYELIKGGGLYSAEWGWRDQEGSSNLFGIGDIRHFDNPINPFSGDDREAYGLEVLYSTVFNRLLVFRRETPGGSAQVVKIAYRDMNVDTDLQTYSTTTFTPDRWGTPNEKSNLVGVELPDGELRLFVQYQETATQTDFDVYGSSDGGLTWTLLTQNVLRQFGLAQNTYGFMRGDISGDWIRICFVDLDNSNRIRTFVSSDRGATWMGVTFLADSVFDNTYDYDEFSYDIVGIDDQSGGFLLILMDTNSSVNIYYAAGEQDWQEQTDFSASFFFTAGANDKLDRVFFAKDSNRIYAFGWYRDSAIGETTAGWVMRSVRIDRVLDLTEWSAQMDTDAEFPAFNGTARYRMANIHATFAADRIVVAFGLADNLTDGTGGISADVGLHDFQGWTQMSLASSRGPQGIPQTSNRLFDHEWIVTHGRPAGSGSNVASTTEWTEALSGTNTITWGVGELQLVSDPASSAVYSLDEGGSPTNEWAEGGLFTWTNKVELSSGTGADRVHTRIRAFGDSGADKVDVSVRYRATGGSTLLVVQDNIAGIALFTSAQLSFDTEFYQYRLTMLTPVSAVRMYLAYKAVAAMTWANTGLLDLDAGGAAASQSVDFGNGLNVSPGSTSLWREFRIAPSDRNIQNFDPDEDMRGRTTTPKPTYVWKGVSTRWGGGGGFLGDIFDEEKQYSQGAINLFTPSPDMRWQSTAATSQSIIFNAGSSRVFIHNAIGFFNAQARRVIVEYADDLAFTSIVATETVSFATAVSGTTFPALKGDSAQIAGTGVTDYTKGELVGYFFRQDGGSPAKAFKVTKQIDDYVQAGESNNDLLTAGFTVGGPHFIVSPDAAHVYSTTAIAQYMRLTFDTPTARMLGPNICSAYAVGAMVVGTSLPIRVAMDWVHDDTQAGNIDLTEAPGGKKWSFKQGPARRTVEGRITGDVSQYRDEFRKLMDSLADYSKRPMVLVLNDQELIRREQLLYCRYDGPTSHENVAWKADDASIQRRIGNQGVRFIEEV